MDNDKYIEKWLSNSLSKDELRVFEGSKDYKSLKKLDHALQNFKAPKFDIQGELARLNEAKGVGMAGGKVIEVSWFQPMVRIAAVIVIVIISYLLFTNNSVTTIDSGIAQKTELTLPDESIVILNASSTISYSEKQWEKQRKVQLKGEAYFNVTKGSQFDVETSAGVVMVLGTEFNVKVRNNYFEVICYKGLVAVKSANENLDLPANHMFRIVDGVAYYDNELKYTAPSWIINESSFVSVPYEQVIREFERQYNVMITTNEVDLEQLFTGRFIHSDISLALKSISLPLNLRYELGEDQHIVLTGDIK